MAMPEELIRCYEEKTVDENGNRSEKKVSLMFRKDVPQFRTEFFATSMVIYNNWKLFNQACPNGQGWANERNSVCQILHILESESVKYDAWERDKERSRRDKA